MRMDHNSSIQAMAQHFLLSPVARALRDDDLQFISDARNEGLAYLLFMLFRWGSLTTQICPKCGVIDEHQPRVAHKQWRCKHCRHDFSLKSGSLFEGTKLSYSTLLKAMLHWSQTSKGTSAVAMTRVLNIGYQAAYLLLHKFRYGLLDRAKEFRFRGEIEIDVVWAFKHQRKANCRSRKALRKHNQMLRRKFAVALMRSTPTLSRKDARRLAAKEISLDDRTGGPNPKKRPLLAIIERGQDGRIARSVGVLLRAESLAEVAPEVLKYVEPGSKIFTDAASAYSGLAARYELTQINHETHYSLGDGKHTNGVEAGFSRWRRMEKGTYHRMNARTIERFFAECAWREEHRRTHPAERLFGFIKCMIRAGARRELKKYGTSQLAREYQPRRIQLTAMPLPEAASIDRLCGISLLTEAMLEEAGSLRADLQPRPSFASVPPAPRVRTWDRRPKSEPLGVPFAPRPAFIVPLTMPNNYSVTAMPQAVPRRA
jgi:transposase-like protein